MVVRLERWVRVAAAKQPVAQHRDLHAELSRRHHNEHRRRRYAHRLEGASVALNIARGRAPPLEALFAAPTPTVEKGREVVA